MTINSKQPNTGTTIFTIMSKLAADCGAMNLSQGFPNFDCSPKLTDLVNHYLKKGMNQYAPMTGIQSLREAIAQKVIDLYQVNYHPDTEVTVTTGATEALYAAITAVVQQSDEVILLEPCYDSYASAQEIAQGIRGHWGIENRTHWVKDVNFQEDNNRIKNDNGAVNMAIFNTISLNYLRQNIDDSIKNAQIIFGQNVKELFLAIRT